MPSFRLPPSVNRNAAVALLVKVVTPQLRGRIDSYKARLRKNPRLALSHLGAVGGVILVCYQFGSGDLVGSLNALVVILASLGVNLPPGVVGYITDILDDEPEAIANDPDGDLDGDDDIGPDIVGPVEARVIPFQGTDPETNGAAN